MLQIISGKEAVEIGEGFLDLGTPALRYAVDNPVEIALKGLEGKLLPERAAGLGRKLGD